LFLVGWCVVAVNDAVAVAVAVNDADHVNVNV
jgi:hypothetical protein